MIRKRDTCLHFHTNSERKCEERLSISMTIKPVLTIPDRGYMKKNKLRKSAGRFDL